MPLRPGSEPGHTGLDGLLSRASPSEPFERRLRWLAALLAWVGRSHGLETLSAGFLAASTSALGVEAFGAGRCLWAGAGLVSMAVFNVGVSFALALFPAVRAQGLSAPERHVLVAAFWRRLRRHPADLVVPEEAATRTA